MGRKNKKYSKSLHQQAYEKLAAMQAFGESKKAAIAAGTDKDRIFSYGTYKTYWKHIKYFLKWVEQTHPECTTLKSARKYVNEWLTFRASHTTTNGERISAWTIHTETAALNKLYGITKNDPERFIPPARKREDVRRSRLKTRRDQHFSITNNNELIRFCRGTGCRRNVLERLEGRDLWTRDQMEAEVVALRDKEKLSDHERLHLTALHTALQTFPDQDYFLHHRKDKNGRYRFAPIVGPDKEMILDRMRRTGKNEKVWLHVHTCADIHGYRADYAKFVYRLYARPIDEIPYDRVNRGTGARYQSDVYVCQRDEAGRHLDREAMTKASRALGHNRVSVVAESYLHGL